MASVPVLYEVGLRVRDVFTLEATVDRALAIARTAPAGPVSLMLPREKLMDPLQGRFAFTDMTPSLDFRKLVEAAGGHGERIEDPAELPAAIARALAVVRTERRQALLDVVTR